MNSSGDTEDEVALGLAREIEGSFLFCFEFLAHKIRGDVFAFDVA